MAAPSACNKRPWMFYVVKSKDLQLQLRKASPYTDKNSSLIINNKLKFLRFDIRRLTTML